MLYYTTLYYTILYYTTLYYTILCYTIPYYTILYYTILHYTTTLHYAILKSTHLALTPTFDLGDSGRSAAPTTSANERVREATADWFMRAIARSALDREELSKEKQVGWIDGRKKEMRYEVRNEVRKKVKEGMKERKKK